jgi:hypothetical protein
LTMFMVQIIFAEDGDTSVVTPALAVVGADQDRVRQRAVWNLRLRSSLVGIPLSRHAHVPQAECRVFRGLMRLPSARLDRPVTEASEQPARKPTSYAGIIPLSPTLNRTLRLFGLRTRPCGGAQQPN